MKLPLPVIALQSLRHDTPKPPPSKTEGGAPPRCYSPMKCRGGILSSHAAVKRKEREVPGPPVPSQGGGGVSPSAGGVTGWSFSTGQDPESGDPGIGGWLPVWPPTRP